MYDDKLDEMISRKKRSQLECCKINDRTKQNLEKALGMTINDFNELDTFEQILYIEEKTGIKTTFPSDACADCYPIKTMEQMDKGISMIKK